MTENQLLSTIRTTKRIKSPNSSTATLKTRQIKAREIRKPVKSD